MSVVCQLYSKNLQQKISKEQTPSTTRRFTNLFHNYLKNNYSSSSLDPSTFPRCLRLCTWHKPPKTKWNGTIFSVVLVLNFPQTFCVFHVYSTLDLAVPRATSTLLFPPPHSSDHQEHVYILVGYPTSKHSMDGIFTYISPPKLPSFKGK